jgi:hypothetical protein
MSADLKRILRFSRFALSVLSFGANGRSSPAIGVMDFDMDFDMDLDFVDGIK